jgi:hypothetical protein
LGSGRRGFARPREVNELDSPKDNAADLANVVVVTVTGASRLRDGVGSAEGLFRGAPVTDERQGSIDLIVRGRKDTAKLLNGTSRSLPAPLRRSRHRRDAQSSFRRQLSLGHAIDLR